LESPGTPYQQEALHNDLASATDRTMKETTSESPTACGMRAFAPYHCRAVFKPATGYVALESFMRLEPLYRLRFTYPEGWETHLAGALGKEEQHFYLAEGRCEGRISGHFRASNAPRRRADGVFSPNFHGVIETDDGATIYLEYHGYGRTHPVGRRQWLVAGAHVSDAERYAWLNDAIIVGTGEVRRSAQADANPNASPDLVLDVAEVIWEPIPE
jgi:hypothetical protein